MDAQLQQLDPASERHQVLQAARGFKASWVALGQRLTLAREQKQFVGWGFSSFEAYCRRELRLRPETANKLTRSFAFLRDHQPEAASGPTQRELPPLDVVDLLSQAKERTQLTPEALSVLQEEAFAPEAKVTKQGLLKKLREVDPQAFRAVNAPATPADSANDDPSRRIELRKALLLAERLESVLRGQGGISEQAMGHARSVVSELRERFAQDSREGAA